MWFDNLSSIHFLLKEDNGQSKIPRRKARVWGKREQDEGEASQALAQVQNLRGCKKVSMKINDIFMKYFEQSKLVQKVLDE